MFHLTTGINTLFFRFLRWAAEYKQAMVNDRIRQLTDSLACGDIDLDTFIVRKSDMTIEKQLAVSDFNKWDAALHAILINPKETL